MAARKKRLGNVTRIESDYVVHQEKKMVRQAKQRKRTRRRAVVLFGLFAIVLFATFYYKYTQEQSLASKLAEKKQLKLELEKEKKKKEAYQQEITNLNDPEYMAKLARQQYFLSKEGEIIFKPPEKDDNNED